MYVTQTIKIELTKKEVNPISAFAVSGELGTRLLCFELYENGLPWVPGAQTQIAMTFRTENGFHGEYDTMPDGSAATTCQENRITVRLIDQILFKAGIVELSLLLLDQCLNRMITFPVRLQVEQGIDETVRLPEVYYQVRNLSEINAALRALEVGKGDGLMRDLETSRLFLTCGEVPIGDGILIRDGIDGISPTVTMESVEGGTKLIISDENGSAEALIRDGKDAPDCIQQVAQTPACPVSKTGIEILLELQSCPPIITALSAEGNPTVKISGKNWIDHNAVARVDYYTYNGDPNYKNGILLDIPGTYTISGVSGTNSYVYANIMDENNRYKLPSPYYVHLPDKVTPATITISEGERIFVYDAAGNALATSKAIFERCQIQAESGSNPTAYEPYRPVKTVAADSADSWEGYAPTTRIYNDTGALMTMEALVSVQSELNRQDAELEALRSFIAGQHADAVAALALLEVKP